MNQKTTLLWLRDTIEHLATCQQQLEWSEDSESIGVLTETMLRDLESCRKLCQSLHKHTRQWQAA